MEIEYYRAPKFAEYVCRFIDVKVEERRYKREIHRNCHFSSEMKFRGT